jgi:hypothetical protein
MARKAPLDHPSPTTPPHRFANFIEKIHRPSSGRLFFAVSSLDTEDTGVATLRESLDSSVLPSLACLKTPRPLGG